MRLLPIAIAIALSATAPSTAVAQDPSRITVHSLGSDYAVPAAINNRGQVVGARLRPDGRFVPFRWTRQSGLKTIRNVVGVARDVNDRGEVVGFFQPANSTLEHGFVWNATRGFRDLGAGFVPTAINNRGEIAGTCLVETEGFPRQHACRRSSRGRVAVLDGAGFSFANGINERGEIVGSISGRPAKWRRDGSLTMLDDRVGYPEFSLAAHDINNRGMIVGQLHLDTHDPTNPVLWSRDGVIEVLHLDSGFAGAINSRGTSAGSASNTAVVWTGEGVRIDLGPGASSSALDINDRGDVVGYVERTVDERRILVPVLWRLNGADRR